MATQSGNLQEYNFWDRIITSDGWLKFMVKAALIAAAVLLVIGGSIIIGLTEFGVYVVLGLLGVMTLVMILARPYIGLYILIIFYYLNLSWNATDQFGIPSLNRPMIAFIAGAVLMTRLGFQREKLVFRWTEAIIVLYLAVLAISSIFGQHTETTAEQPIIELAKDLALIIIILQVSYHEPSWKRAQWLLIACAAFVSTVNLVQWITGSYERTFLGMAAFSADAVAGSNNVIGLYRAGGMVGEPNYFAQMLLMVYPLAFYRGLYGRNALYKLAGWSAAALMMGTILITYSRAGFVMAIIVTFVILIVERVNLLNILATGLIALLIGLPLMPEGFVERLLALTDEGPGSRQDISLVGRTSEALVALRMFEDYPLLGIGYSTYEDNYLDYSRDLGLDSRYENREAHSLYLEALAETGLVGIGAFALMIGAIFTAVRRSYNKLNTIGREDLKPWIKGLAFGTIGYLLTSIFLHDAYSHYLRISLALTLSSTVIVDYLIRDYQQRRMTGTANVTE